MVYVASAGILISLLIQLGGVLVFGGMLKEFKSESQRRLNTLEDGQRDLRSDVDQMKGAAGATGAISFKTAH